MTMKKPWPKRRGPRVASTALLVVLAAFAALAISGVVTAPDRPEPLRPEDLSRSFSRQEITQDIDFLVQTIQDVHINPFTRTSEAEFRRAIEELEAGIEEPLTRTGLYRKLAPTVAMLEDGHTTVSLLSEEINDHARNDGPWFPLSLSISDSATTVVDNYSSEPSIAPGSRLVSINGLAIEEIVHNLTGYISSGSYSHRLATVEESFLFYLWLAYEWEDRFDIAFAPAGTEETLSHTVEGITYSEIRQRRDESAVQQDEQPFAFLSEPETRTGILEVELFWFQQEFESFLEESFTEIQAQQLDRLIIDLRENGGGSTNVSSELLRYIADEPFRNFARYDLKISRQIKEYYKQQLPDWLRLIPLQYLFPQGRKIWGAPDGTTVTFDGDFIEPVDASRRFNGNVIVRKRSPRPPTSPPR
jgi:hypothetical protein